MGYRLISDGSVSNELSLDHTIAALICVSLQFCCFSGLSVYSLTASQFRGIPLHVRRLSVPVTANALAKSRHQAQMALRGVTKADPHSCSWLTVPESLTQARRHPGWQSRRGIAAVTFISEQ